MFTEFSCLLRHHDEVPQHNRRSPHDARRRRFSLLESATLISRAVATSEASIGLRFGLNSSNTRGPTNPWCGFLDSECSPAITMDISQHASSDSSPATTTTPLLFLSCDLIHEIATFLVDDAATLMKLTCVSKSCCAAILEYSPRVWKATCEQRWKSKWGFMQRYQAAQQELQQLQEQQGLNTSEAQWWRSKYTWQEQDAKRQSITAVELHSLTFDFRFWLSQFWGHGNLLASGLKWTASQNFQFAPRPIRSNNDDDDPLEYSWPGQHQERGVLKGHPSGRDDLEWFLDPDGLGMQWGKLPQLWPRGTIHRLETWGWEIRNPNVCLRAMDSVVNGETNRTDDDLWKDYLHKLRRYPTDFGMPQEGIAFLEAPEEFWEFPQNRQRFPRLGIDEVLPLEE